MNILVLIFNILNVVMLVVGLLTNYGTSLLPQFIVQLFRYGRANMSNTKSVLLTSIEVPKRWFYHFYSVVVLLQITVCVSILGSYYLGFQTGWLQYVLSFLRDQSVTATRETTAVAVLLFCFHLSRRLFETLRVSVFSNTKMNLLHYLLGYVHYVCAILCLVAHSPLTPGTNTGTTGILEIFSVLAFFTGNYIQNRAHVGLANLRKGNDKKQSMGHKIPHGQLFEYISCPNYFGEIIIYCGIACLFGLKNTSWNACTLWVICNQITAGIMNHKWYVSTFQDYPKSRKAIIPFIL